MATLVEATGVSARNATMEYQQSDSPVIDSTIAAAGSNGSQPVVQSYRCRLYRSVRNVLPGQDFFVEVWDCEENPVVSKRLPTGDDLVACFSDPSRSRVREMLDDFCEKHGFFLTGSWSLQGSL